jgi:hypothetical protein
MRAILWNRVGHRGKRNQDTGSGTAETLNRNVSTVCIDDCAADRQAASVKVICLSSGCHGVCSSLPAMAQVLSTIEKIISCIDFKPGLRSAHLVSLLNPEKDIGTTTQSLLAAAGPASLLLLATTASFQVATGYPRTFLFAVSAISHHLGNR